MDKKESKEATFVVSDLNHFLSLEVGLPDYGYQKATLDI